MTSPGKRSELKHTVPPFYASLKKTGSHLLLVYIPLLLLLSFAGIQTKIPPAYLTRDPLVVARVPYYYGFFSNLGILLWCATATICLFSFFILKQNRETNSERLSFLLASGLITTLLLFDDLYMLHESFFPDFLKIPEKLLYSGYGILLIGCLIRFRKIILRTEFLSLAIALLLFFFSLIVDAIGPSFTSLGDYRVFIEDSFKLLGIASWFVYYTTLSMNSMVTKLSSNSTEEEPAFTR